MRIIAKQLNMNVFVFVKHYHTQPETGTADGATDAAGDAESDGDGARGTETGGSPKGRRARNKAPQRKSRKGADQTHGDGKRGRNAPKSNEHKPEKLDVSRGCTPKTRIVDIDRNFASKPRQRSGEYRHPTEG